MRNKKSQTVLTIVFFTFVFIIIWALFIAKQLNEWGRLAVINGQLTGIEALFYSHINVVIGIVLLIFIIAIGYFGSKGGS